MQRRGVYPQPGPRPAYEIPGLEFAGTIDKIGPGVAGWQEGDRVCGLLGGAIWPWYGVEATISSLEGNMLQRIENIINTKHR